MPQFCKLADPQSYQACDWDLRTDLEGRAAWIDIFDEHTESLLEHARTSDYPPSETAMAAYREAFLEVLNRLRREHEIAEPLDIYVLCKIRADMMREYGLGDPYDRVKRTENLAALGHLPGVLAKLDAEPDDRLVETLFRGILAGNKFDLGAKETVDQHSRGGINFFETLDQLGDRPWFVDELDAVIERLRPAGLRYRRAIYFVDNAGGDVVLGALPLARYLASHGCAVVLAANDAPSLNDVTVGELNDVLALAADGDDALARTLASRRISSTGTGCDCPLIDLADVTAECNTAAEDCDLVILEGMGRAVETNYFARFTCDAIHLAMIKNRELTKRLGCRLFDLIVRFTPGGATVFPPP